MSDQRSKSLKFVLLAAAIVLLALGGLALFRQRPATPLSASDQKYREVIQQCIRDGKREFSAPTPERVQIVIQAAKDAGFRVTTEKLAEGARVHLSPP